MKHLKDIDFYSISMSDARNLGPFGAYDKPVTIECYRKKEQWKSRKAALEFFTAGANSCSGSERERYSAIVSKLKAGKSEVNDSYWN